MSIGHLSSSHLNHNSLSFNCELNKLWLNLTLFVVVVLVVLAFVDLPMLPYWVSGSGKVVIIDYAAHSMLSYFAQGIAHIIEDGCRLAEELSKCDSKSDIPSHPEALKD